MEKLNMHSMNITVSNIEKIAALFPSCVTETLSDDGKKKLGIDFDKLRLELGADVIDEYKERYQFTWPNKRDAIRLANSPINKTLRPCREESVDFDNTKNLYIEGDNLEALKLLQENYLGKVKMIYIDPPYNTGNDFVYKDKRVISADDYADMNGEQDEEGNQLVKNTESNGRFHTDWLNFIYPRLKVAKNLLTKDGLIFISIDDNEVDNLRKICDELFGESCFVAEFVWEKRLNRENRKEVSVRHDYILCYSKQAKNENVKRLYQLPMNEKALSSYNNPDNDPNGLWKSDPAHTQGGHGTKSQFYTLIAPNGKKHELPSGRCWVYTEEKMQSEIKAGKIWFGMDGNGVPRIKTYLNAKERGLTPETIMFASESSTNEKAKNDLKALFDGISVFETPKPMELVKNLMQFSVKEGIVLDFFSGCATTAHSVLKLNSEDGLSRQFIMVQLQEETAETSEAYKAGYKNICEIGKERIRRAGAMIKAENPNIDTGFRVLKIDESNMENVYYTPAETLEQNLFANNIKQDRTAEDLLFQIMPECAIELSAKIETMEIAGKTVFNVADGYLMACFDEEVNEDTITAIAKQKPAYFVMRDSGVATDNVVDNFDQIFKAYSPDTKCKIL